MSTRLTTIINQRGDRQVVARSTAVMKCERSYSETSRQVGPSHPTEPYSLLPKLVMNEKESCTEHQAQPTDRHVGDAKKRIFPAQPRRVRENQSFRAFELCHWVIVVNGRPVLSPETEKSGLLVKIPECLQISVNCLAGKRRLRQQAYPMESRSASAVSIREFAHRREIFVGTRHVTTRHD